MAILFAAGRFKATDKGNEPIPGAFLSFYATQTSTFQPIYTDNTLSTVLTNPVKADANGLFPEIWLDDLLPPYKVIFSSPDISNPTVPGSIVWSISQYNSVIDPSAFVDTLLPFLYPLSDAEKNIGVIPTNYGYPQGDLRRYGADPTGTNDSTIAFQLAINVAQANSNGSTVVIPTGIFKVTSQISILSNRIRLVGSGMYASQILFAPLTDGICIKIANGSTEINQCSLSDFCIYSNDSTHTKTAIDITDQSGCDYERIVIGGGVVVGGAGFWSGGSGSIGIRTRGRDTSTFRDITAFCDKPLVISINPHSSISIDHHNFHNCFLGGNGNPIVTIESGVTLTQVSFTGYQAWVLGTGGLYWVDATSPGSSNGLTIENLRYEGSTDATKYVAQINVTSPLQMFVIRGGQAGACRGFHLRNITQACFEDFYYTDNAKEAFNADNTCAQIYCKSCTWQNGSTATLSNLMVVKSDPTPSSGPIPGDGLLMPSGSFYQETRDETSSGPVTTLTASATVQVGLGSQLGWLVVTDDTDQVVGTFFLKGTNHGTTLGPVSDAGFFSTTSGNANTINCYWDGSSHYVVQNGYGVSKTVRISGKVGKI